MHHRLKLARHAGNQHFFVDRPLVTSRRDGHGALRFEPDGVDCTLSEMELTRDAGFSICVPVSPCINRNGPLAAAIRAQQHWLNGGGTEAKVCFIQHSWNLIFVIIASAHLIRKGRGALRFELDGVDRTAAEMKLTQEAIDETFSTDLMTRAVFFGQTEVNALLEVCSALFWFALSFHILYINLLTCTIFFGKAEVNAIPRLSSLGGDAISEQAAESVPQPDVQEAYILQNGRHRSAVAASKTWCQRKSPILYVDPRICAGQRLGFQSRACEASGVRGVGRCPCCRRCPRQGVNVIRTIIDWTVSHDVQHAVSLRGPVTRATRKGSKSRFWAQP